MKEFNTTGPCDPDEHYMLPPEERLVGTNLNRYIEKKLYWVLHAPRRTGKTTFLISWMRELNASGKYVACYVSVERCQGIPDIERRRKD
jgi:predicted AAA+ superfamily ATPase